MHPSQSQTEQRQPPLGTGPIPASWSQQPGTHIPLVLNVWLELLGVAETDLLESEIQQASSVVITGV